MKYGERPTVLVVEDEFIIALDLSETVRDLGFKVEGPFADKENAFIAIDQHMPDCAILDVKTADGEGYPLADALAEAGVPIIFHSGHIASTDIAERYPDAIACSKPCPPDRLIAVIGNALEHAATG
jgi:DNA-binding NtrC family response regulator